MLEYPNFREETLNCNYITVIFVNQVCAKGELLYRECSENRK